MSYEMKDSVIEEACNLPYWSASFFNDTQVLLGSTLKTFPRRGTPGGCGIGEAIVPEKYSSKTMDSKGLATGGGMHKGRGKLKTEGVVVVKGASRDRASLGQRMDTPFHFHELSEARHKLS
jgi:hypothetical protein